MAGVRMANAKRPERARYDTPRGEGEGEGDAGGDGFVTGREGDIAGFGGEVGVRTDWCGEGAVGGGG